MERVDYPRLRRGLCILPSFEPIDGLAGVVSVGYYCAAKFAVEGLSDALCKEVEPLSIKVTLVESRRFPHGMESRRMKAGS